MADKQIKDLDLATILEDTDSIPLQTAAGLTKHFTPTVLKNAFDGRYQKQGVLIYVNSAPLGGEIIVSSDKITADSGIRLLLSNMVMVEGDVMSVWGAQYLNVPPANKWGGLPWQNFNVSLYNYDTELFESAGVHINYDGVNYSIITDEKLKVKEVWII